MLEKWSRCYCKSKMIVDLKFSTTIAPFHVFQPKKVFENSSNTFEDIEFRLGQRKREKLKFLQIPGIGKVAPLALQTQNICELEIFNHNSHLPCLSAKKSFWKFVKYFWRYSISSDTVYTKNWYFSFSGCWKSGHVPIAKAKWLCAWNFQPQ